jgi:hypothetical protein
MRRFAPEDTIVGMRRCAAFPTYALDSRLYGKASLFQFQPENALIIEAATTPKGSSV